MSFWIGLAIIAVVCALAVWILPPPKFGSLKGCTGQALQSVMEEKKKEEEQKKRRIEKVGR